MNNFISELFYDWFKNNFGYAEEFILRIHVPKWRNILVLSWNDHFQVAFF